MTRVLTACLVLAAAGAAAAATPRVQALGGDGAYLEDAGNVLRWPGSLSDHAGRISCGSGVFDGHGYPRDGDRATGPWIGAQYALGEDGRGFAGALYLLSRASGMSDSGLGASRQTGTVHAVLALPGEEITAAVGWRRADASDSPRGERREEFGLGLRLDLDPRAYLDLAGEIVHLHPPDAVRDTLPAEEEFEVGYILRTRLFVEIAPSLVLVSVLAVDMEDRTWALPAGNPRWPDRHFRLGTALTWLPDPDRMALVSVDYRDFGIPHVWMTDALLFRAAVEARLNAFLSLRVAAGWEERNGGEESRAPLSLGLGVHAWNWDLDLAAGTEPPLDAVGRRADFGPAALGWLSAAFSYSF